MNPRRASLLRAAVGAAAVAGLSIWLAFATAQLPPQDRPWAYDGPKGDPAMLRRHKAILKRVAATRDARVAFIGDSITEFFEGTGREAWEKFSTGRKAVNLGVSGDRTGGCLWRLENGELDGIRLKLVVVLIGTNNTWGDEVAVEENVRGIRAVVGKVREKQPEAKVLLLALFPREDPGSNGKWKKVNALLAAEKFDDAVEYLDIGERFLDDKGKITRGYLFDKLHLSAEGYRLWAEAIEPKVKAALGE